MEEHGAVMDDSLDEPVFIFDFAFTFHLPSLADEGLTTRKEPETENSNG
jgi:hypothetical protein